MTVSDLLPGYQGHNIFLTLKQRFYRTLIGKLYLLTYGMIIVIVALHSSFAR